jgi:SagB-type dehydrogenase family enzyme
MNTKLLIGVVLFIVGYVAAQYISPANIPGFSSSPSTQERGYIAEPIALPTPQTYGALSVEQAMQNRRSRRAYTDESLTLEAVSQVLWALQGQTADWGGRTVPSAKSAYPLQVTVVVKNVADLPPGVYHYISETHSLAMTMDAVPAAFDEAAVQGQNKAAPIVFILSGDYAVMTKAFDGKANDVNVVLEAGHAGQNAYLQVESLGLGTVVSGGFNHELMQEALSIPAQEDLFYLIPVGIPAQEVETEH